MENQSHEQIIRPLRRILFLAGLFFSACSSPVLPEKEVSLYFRTDTMLLRDGDLIFRLGTGLGSRAVVMPDSDARYSHVGLLVHEGGEWKVLHAVPGEVEDAGGGEVLKKDPLVLFLRPDRAVSACVMRYDTTEEALAEVCRQGMRLFEKRIPFDYAYDITDSSRMYCTEYVCRLFRCVGVDLAEGRRHRFPMVGQEVVCPLDIERNPRLREVFSLSKKK